MRTRPAVIGMLAAITLFFLGMLISAQSRSDSGGLGSSLLIFAGIALPGGLIAWWMSGRPRR